MTGAAGRPDEAGFSLVELMVAMVLIVIGVIAIMQSCIQLHALQRLDDELGYAYRACRTNVEQVRKVPLGSLLAVDGTDFDVPGADGLTPILAAVPGDADGMPGEIRVRLERSSGGRELYFVEAEVTWQGAAGRHTVSFATMWGGVP